MIGSPLRSWLRWAIPSVLAVLALAMISFAIAFEVVGNGHPLLFRAMWYFWTVCGVAASQWLAWKYHRRRRTRARLLSDLYALTPAEFEQSVADLLSDLGYRHVARVGRAGDRGVDITGKDPKGVAVGVQCKRYAPGARVGSPDIQKFLGALTVHGLADNGYGLFVTTSEFTAPARDLARRHHIELIDGPSLGVLIARVQGKANVSTPRVPQSGPP